jgi:hypothetical protein
MNRPPPATEKAAEFTRTTRAGARKQHRTGQETNVHKKHKDTRRIAPKTSARASLSRISSLTRQLSVDLNYATAPSTVCYWSRSQARRSWQSIERKQAECRRLIAQLPASELQEALLEVTEEAWRAAEEQHRDRPDPELPLLAEQRELLAEIRRAA